MRRREGFRRQETERRIQREAGGECTWSMVLVQWSELTEELATEGEIFGLNFQQRGGTLEGFCEVNALQVPRGADSAHGNEMEVSVIS